MAIHKIVYTPDPRLRQVCDKLSVEEILSPNIQTLIDDMFETMYAERGVGLAANQIGITKQITVIDVIGDKTQQYCLINPEIIDKQGAEKMQEGCLSVPGCYDTVTRPTYVKAKALNRHGELFELEGRGLLAECLEHEIDHLNGKLYIDLLSPIRRQRIKNKLSKLLKKQLRE